MSKKNRNREGGMFDNLQDVPSLEESTDAIFGINPFPVTPAIKVRMVDIASIYPDPVQPRRAVPSELRARWNIHEQSFADLIALWFSYMDSDFDLDAYLLDGNTKRAQIDKDNQPILPVYEPTDPVQVSFIRLLELAASILREGLTNPITISRAGRDYVIETGERRWLAYHLLNVYFENHGEQDWSKIPAQVMQERSVWRQATENNARQNLNAVARARQLAILLMDIHGWEKFQPLADFEDEQDFYAQVGDGEEWRIPADKTELLLKVMSLNNQTQLRQYRSILRIDSTLWRMADDNDWTENAIRQANRKLKQRTKSSTPKEVPTVVDRTMDRLLNDRQSILNKATQAKGKERSDWQKFAREQASWWEQLAQKLDK